MGWSNNLESIGFFTNNAAAMHVIEHDNKNAEVIAALCMTYLQLWPYSYQDSSDSKTIAFMVKWSSEIDPAGMHSATCRAMDLIVRSRLQEAK